MRANKYKWIIENGNIKSAKDQNYCLTIDSTSSVKQRSNLYPCDGSNDQLFDISSGVIRSGNLCGQYSANDLSSNSKTPFVFQTCNPSLFIRKRKQENVDGLDELLNK